MRVKLNGDSGFTLLELLVSMSILAVVITVVVEAFWLGQRSWEQGNEVVEVELRLRTAVDIISKQLSSTFPVEVKKKDSDGAFSGSREEITFVTSMPMGFERRAGLFYVGYYLEEDKAGGHKTLKVIQRPYYTDKPLDIEDRDNGYTVLAGLEVATWDYFTDGAWVDEFNGEYGRLPERVRFTLALSDGESYEMVISIFTESNREQRTLVGRETDEYVHS